VLGGNDLYARTWNCIHTSMVQLLRLLNGSPATPAARLLIVNEVDHAPPELDSAKATMHARLNESRVVSPCSPHVAAWKVWAMGEHEAW
jgi:hypothetical protein